VIVDFFRNLADLALFSVVIWAQWRIGSSILAASRNRPARIGGLIRTLMAAGFAMLVVGFTLSFAEVSRVVHVPSWLRGVLNGGAYLWAFISTGAYLIHRLWRLFIDRTGAAAFDPGRRKLVNAAGSTLAAVPFAMAGFGSLVQRTDFHVREVDIAIPNLPRDLQGLRVLQLSDIHLGPFLTERNLARVIDESRNLRPHLAVITGDLISMAGDPLDACLRQIARLRPDAGILGCLGNHEIYAGVQEYTTEQGARLGIDFLRERTRPLRFGESTLNVAGVDYQPQRLRGHYLHGAERLIAPGAVNVLLSHNPNVFPVAARQGFDLTISGHTHGGQVNIEILHQNLNVARFLTPFVYGRYNLDRASLYVSRGIGTINLPIRIGAPPEITLLRLTAV
jgi:predicted MPP superfamily phosphohydrolase